jgi:hypothetical protein
MDPLGNFCSWGCASLYINLYFTSDKWEKHGYLRLLYKIFTGEHIDEIIPAGPKTDMRQYGGNKSPREYRESLMDLNETYKTAIQHNRMDSLQIKN